MKNIWMYLFFGITIIYAATTSYFVISSSSEELALCQTRYRALEDKYISLAKSQIYWHNLVITKKVPIKKYMKEYDDLSNEEFIEGQRRKLVALDLHIKHLQNEE